MSYILLNLVYTSGRFVRIALFFVLGIGFLMQAKI